MAGFFGFFDYTKPGPGVPKDAPPKSPFIVFFEILQRKFWNLVKVNLMFNIFNIPAMILGMAVLLFYFPNIIPDAMTNAELLQSDMIVKFILLTLLMCVPMVTVGPAQAGFTYIMRNYAREEHAFLWSDFKETALKNMKQSLIISSINFVATFLMLWSIRAYFIMAGSNFAMTIGATLTIVMFVIFASMNLYIYPLLITFNLSVKQLYKNALIFAMIKFIPNVGILLLTALINLLLFGLIVPFSQIIGFVLYIFITVSLIGFITNFYAYPKLKKYIISHLEEDEEDDEEDEEENEDEAEDENADQIAENSAYKSSSNALTDNTNETEVNADKDEYNGEDDGGNVGNDGVKRYF